MIYFVVSVILDILLSLMIPSNSLFLPLIFVTSIPFLYIILGKKTYYILLILTGVLYDLLYSDLILLYVLLFIILGVINFFINKCETFSILYTFLLNIFVYNTLYFIIYNKTLNIKFLYILGSSYLLNLLYLFISLIVLKSHILSKRIKINY